MSQSLYQRVLGTDWQRLPPALRELHDVCDSHEYQGLACVENGASMLARICRVLLRFPPASAELPVHVIVQKNGARERWTRRFGAHQFHSVLSAPRDGGQGAVMERFGLLSFRLALPVNEQGLQMPVKRGYCLGVPLPSWLTPRSETREFVDAEGRFNFDVAVSLPGIGLIVRYQGWLQPSKVTQ